MSINQECKWVRKTKTYPEWFISLLVNDSDKQLALDNKLSSKTKVFIRCEQCGNTLERYVYNVVSKKTGEKVRPCLCKECYTKWNNAYLEETRDKWNEKRIEFRKNREIPQVVLDSLAEPYKQKLRDGLLDHNKEATFICSSCGKSYKILFKLRWDCNFTEVYKNHCSCCSKESCSKLLREFYADRRIGYTQEFIDTLYYDKDKELAKNKTLSTNDRVYFKCFQCGNPVIKNIPHVYNMSTGEMRYKIYCSQCSPKEHSPLEDEILSFLYTITDEIPVLNTSEILKNPETNKFLELDIYYPNQGIAIEVNGSYWHASQGTCTYLVSKDRQKQKFLLCKAKGIHLVSIFDVDWWHNQQKVKNILSSLLNKSEIIYARNTEVKSMSKQVGREFLVKYHLDNDSNQSLYYYGLFSKKDNSLLSVMSFGRMRGQNSNYDKPDYYELVRFATIPNVKIIGGASKLLKKFEKEFNPHFILSYSDNDYFSGDVYSKLGFNFEKYTVPDYYWFTSTGNEYLPRWKCQLRILSEKYPDLYNQSVNEGVSNKEDYIMTSLKYLKVYRTGQSAWVKHYRRD